MHYQHREHFAQYLKDLNTSTEELSNCVHRLVPQDLDKDARQRALKMNAKLKPVYEIEDYKNLPLPDLDSDLELVHFAKKLTTFRDTLKAVENPFRELSWNAFNISNKGKDKALNKATIENKIANKISNSIYDSFVTPHAFTKEDYYECYSNPETKNLPLPERGKRFNLSLGYSGFVAYGLVLVIISMLINVFTHTTGIELLSPFIILGLLGVFVGYFIRGPLQSLGDVLESGINKMLNTIFYKKKDKIYYAELRKIQSINGQRSAVREQIKEKYAKEKEAFLQERKNELLHFYANIQRIIEETDSHVQGLISVLGFSSIEPNEEVDFCLAKLTHKNASMRANSLEEAIEMYQYQKAQKRRKEEAERERRKQKEKEEAENAKRESERLWRQAILAIPEEMHKSNEIEQDRIKKLEETNERLKEINRKLSE